MDPSGAAQRQKNLLQRVFGQQSSNELGVQALSALNTRAARLYPHMLSVPTASAGPPGAPGVGSYGALSVALPSTPVSGSSPLYAFGSSAPRSAAGVGHSTLVPGAPTSSGLAGRGPTSVITPMTIREGIKDSLPPYTRTTTKTREQIENSIPTYTPPPTTSSPTRTDIIQRLLGRIHP